MSRKKWTTENLIEYVNEHGNGDKLLGDSYLGWEVRLEFLCSRCGKTYMQSPKKFITAHSRCIHCRNNQLGNTRRSNIETLSEYIKNFGDGDELVSETYVNSSTKVKIRCHICKEIYEVRPNNYKTGKRCRKCSFKMAGDKRRSNSMNDVRIVAKERGYEVLSPEYSNIEEKLLFKCSCGEIFEMEMSCFKNGRGCKKCAQKKIGDSKRLDYEFIKEEIERFGCKLISKTYINNQEKLEIECACGSVYSCNWSKFKNGQISCSKCSEIRKRNKLRAINTGNLFLERNLLLLGEYRNAKENVLVRCLVCGFEFETNRDRTVSAGCGCPKCISPMSKGELLVGDFLNGKKIEYLCQHTFADCKDKKLLEYDFYLPQYNTIIEVQGQQHYQPVDFAGRGEEWANSNFALSQYHDQIKRDYCKNNNIKLIEIPYWDFKNIETILTKELDL